MNGETIHGSETHRAQHWAGEYFGEDGALSVARKNLEFVSSLSTDKVSSPRAATIQLVSTVFSALSHCVSQLKKIKKWKQERPFWYLWQAISLLFELAELAEEADKFKAEDMEPGERDVLIAALKASSVVSWLFFDVWYRKRAAELIRMQLKVLPENHPSRLFAQARGCDMSWHFSRAVREDFYENVFCSIDLLSPDYKGGTLSWSEVARLAGMIDQTERQQYAAKMDGSKDALLKSGQA
jgi:hypothetical protein